MSKLLETRAEYVKMLDDFSVNRQAEIDTKVNAYRQTLEATIPTETDETLKIKKVIAALDDVIKLEQDVVSSDEIAQTVVEQPVEQKVEPVQEVAQSDSRINMQSFYVDR